MQVITNDPCSAALVFRMRNCSSRFLARPGRDFVFFCGDVERNSGGVPWWMDAETFRETNIRELDPGIRFSSLKAT